MRNRRLLHDIIVVDLDKWKKMVKLANKKTERKKMARKDDKDMLTFLQMPLPQARPSYKSVKVHWTGLDMRDDFDTGSLSMEMGMSTEEAPYLVPCRGGVTLQNVQNLFEPESPPVDIKVIGLYGFDDYLIAIHSENYKVYAKYIQTVNNGYGDCFICRLNPTVVDINDAYDRDIVQFNVYDDPTNVVNGSYIKKLLVFPDKVSMPVMPDIVKIQGSYPDDAPSSPDTRKLYCFTGGHTDITTFTYYTYNGTAWAQSGSTGYFVPSAMDVVIKTYTNDTAPYLPPDSASTRYYWRNTYNSNVYKWYDDDADSENSGWRECSPPNMPPIKHACVHLSRLFGVDDDRIYASGFNDYTNWNLDTAEEYNESNAWCSPAQSNTKAGGKFTGITAFENHVICFKKNFMHEIYGTKNPFRVQDIFEEGTIDNRTIQNVDGKLIFVSVDGVKLYTGGKPRIISTKLDIKVGDDFTYFVSGTDGRFYYLYCDDGDLLSRKKRILVYDTYIGEWSERGTSYRIKSFARNSNGIYALFYNAGFTRLITKFNTGSYLTTWWFETDLITRRNGTPTVDIKHLKKIQLLVNFGGNTNSNSRLKIYVLYDGEAYNYRTSRLLYDSGTVTAAKTVPIRVKVRKSAHHSVKLHFEGSGYIKFYEMELFFEDGGDLYVS